MMTPQQQKENLDQITPFALLIGFLGNGKRDACVCLSQEDVDKEVKRFETYKKWAIEKVNPITDDKKESL